jgi:hypothetical protein
VLAHTHASEGSANTWYGKVKRLSAIEAMTRQSGGRAPLPAHALPAVTTAMQTLLSNAKGVVVFRPKGASGHVARLQCTPVCPDYGGREFNGKQSNARQQPAIAIWCDGENATRVTVACAGKTGHIESLT